MAPASETQQTINDICVDHIKTVFDLAYLLDLVVVVYIEFGEKPRCAFFPKFANESNLPSCWFLVNRLLRKKVPEYQTISDIWIFTYRKTSA